MWPHTVIQSVAGLCVASHPCLLQIHILIVLPSCLILCAALMLLPNVLPLHSVSLPTAGLAPAG